MVAKGLVGSLFFVFFGGGVEFGNLVEDVDGIFGGVSMCVL